MGVLGTTNSTTSIATTADLDAHVNDTVDAHDASAVSVVPAGNIVSTTVQAALQELDGDIAAGGIPATIVDAKGDLIAGTAADTVARLAALANGAALITASGETTGLKWRLNNDGAAAAPTVNDDSGDGYSIGSRWLDTTADKEYVCLDATAGAAVWVETTATGGGGSDLVQTASGAGSVRIPGLVGSPDIPPGSPSAFNDEFGTTSTFGTVLGSLDTNNTTDFLSHLHLKKTTSGTRIDGVFKTAPSMPFTVTAKISDALFNGGSAIFPWCGLLLTEASPGKCFTYGILTPYPAVGYSTTAVQRDYDYSRWTNNTTRGTFSDKIYAAGEPIAQYIRMVVTSSSSVAMYHSWNGYIWQLDFSAIDTSLTVANIGLFVTAYSAQTMEAVFDWVRFT